MDCLFTVADSPLSTVHPGAPASVRPPATRITPGGQTDESPRRLIEGLTPGTLGALRTPAVRRSGVVDEYWSREYFVM